MNRSVLHGRTVAVAAETFWYLHLTSAWGRVGKRRDVNRRLTGIRGEQCLMLAVLMLRARKPVFLNSNFRVGSRGARRIPEFLTWKYDFRLQ